MSLSHFQIGIEGDIQQLAEITHTPRRYLMPDQTPHDVFGTAMAGFLTDINQQIADARQTPDQVFERLDVQPGDRIRLTEVNKPGVIRHRDLLNKPDGAVLEGKVAKVKRKGGAWKVQIEGFDTAGNGVFWPVRNYKVEVLHRAFRWTDDDRLLVEIAGIRPVDWEKRTDTARQQSRDAYAARLGRIKAIFNPDTDGVE